MLYCSIFQQLFKFIPRYRFDKKGGRDLRQPLPQAFFRMAAVSDLPLYAHGGHFRTVFQAGGKISETAVQFFGLLRGKFAPFGGQPGSFPYRRLVARQRGKRCEQGGLQGLDNDMKMTFEGKSHWACLKSR